MFLFFTHMYKKLLFLIFLTCIGSAFAFAGSVTKVIYYMTVYSTDGSSQDIELNKRPTLIFDKNSLTISTTGDSFLFSDIAKFIFSEKTTSVPTNIDDDALVQKPTLRITDSEVTFFNVGADAKVDVYSVSGQKVLSVAGSSSNDVTVDWASFSRGIYIFRVNNYSFKLLKK